MKQSKLAISAEGEVTMIYSDDTAELLEALGEASIERVSNVEPAWWGRGWQVLMINDESPAACELGWREFALREQALDAEVEYLNDKLFS